MRWISSWSHLALAAFAVTILVSLLDGGDC